MNSILLFPLGEFECATGYVFRIALFNGQRSWWDFCLDFRIDPEHVIHGRSEALEKIASISAQPLPLRERFAVRHHGQAYSVNGQVISKSLLRRERLCVCVRCLSDDL